MFDAPLATRYLNQADMLQVRLESSSAFRVVHVTPGVFIRLCLETKKVIGIDVVGCARFGKSPQEMNVANKAEAFARRLAKKYRKKALKQYKKRPS